MRLLNSVHVAIFFVILLISSGLGFVRDVHAAYSTNGLLVSNNLLAGQDSSAITSFTYTVSAIPANTSLRISFSKDTSNWYSSTGTELGWNTLTTGTNAIDLSALSWSGSAFYYKIEFTSDGSDTPVLDDVNLAFTFAATPSIQEYYTSGTVTSTNVLNGENALAILNFGYSAPAIPAATTLQVRFSQNGSTWYSSAGVADAYDTLTVGANTISLSTLGWTGANFYYQLAFTSDSSATPTLDYINVSFATTVTWTGATNTDWGTATNWDVGYVPSTADNVVIANTANQPLLDQNRTMKNLTINSGATLDINGHNPTLTGAFSNNGTLKLKGGETLTGVTNDTDSGTVTYNGSGAYTELNIGNTYNNLTFNGSGSWTLGSALTVNGNLTLVSGTLDVSASNYGITVAGNWVNTAGVFIARNGTVTLASTSSGATLTSGGDNFYTIVQNGIGGTYTLQDTLTATNNLTITNGTFAAGSSAINIGGNWSNAGSYTGTGTVTFNASSGTQTLTSGGTGVTQDFQNITKSNGGTLQFATNAVDIDGTVTINTGTVVDINGQNVTAGTLVNNGTLLADGSETISITTKDTDSGLIKYDGSGTYTTALSYGNTYYDLEFAGSGVWEPDGAVTTNGNLTITSGTFDIDGQNLTVLGTYSNVGTLRLLGTETVSLTPDTDSGTVSYDNASPLTDFPSPFNDTYYSLTLEGTGAVTLANNLTTNGNLTISSGATLDFNSFDPSIGGNFINNGTILEASTRTFTLNGITQLFTSANTTIKNLLLTGSSVIAGSDLSVSNLLSIAASKSLSLVSYVWSILGNLTNLGSVNEGTGHLAYAVNNFNITDSSFNQDPDISMPGDKVYITLTDLDANTDGTNLNNVSVTVTCPNDSEAVTLDETGVATGIFRNGGLDTATYDGSATADDGTLECADNDTITASYTDPQDNADTATAHSSATTDTMTTAPSGLTGTAMSSSSIKWDWTDNSNNERGFKLYSGTGTLITTINTANQTTYTETGLTKGTSYTRKVVAYNNAGNSSFSSTATVLTPAEPTAPSLLSGSSPSSTSIVWTWTDNSNDETGFKLTESDGTVVATISTANQTEYTETGLTKGTSYTRKVVSYNSDGTSSASNSSTVTTKTSGLSAPVLQSPSNGASLATLLPTFTFGIEPNEDAGIASYIVYIDDSAKYSFPALSQDSGTTISGARVSSSGNSITVTATTDLTEGSHSWKVRAVDAAGNTSDSGQRFFSLDITKPSVALTNTNLNFTSARPTFGLLLSDNRELSKVTVTIEKLTYFLGNELSRKQSFTKTYTIDGTNKALFVTPDVDLAFGKYILTIAVEDTASNKTTSEKEFTILEQTNNEETSLIQAEPPKTATEIKKLVEQGITPTKVPAVFQLQNLEKQAVVRQIKQAINLDEYLQHFMPTKFFTAFNNWLGNVEIKISAWFNNLGTRLAGLFKQVVIAMNRHFSQNSFFVSNLWQRFAGLFRPITTAFNRYFAQSRLFALNSWQRVHNFTQSARLNRLDLAVEAEGGMDRIARPVTLFEQRVALGTKAFVDGFSGQHEKELAITDVFSSQPSPTGVQISWKTNRITRSKVNFGPTTMYGSNVFVDDFSLDHTVNLTDLTPNTKYYFEVLATDVNNEQTYDAYYSFTTSEK